MARGGKGRRTYLDQEDLGRVLILGVMYMLQSAILQLILGESETFIGKSDVKKASS